jgi:hypothetical protein
MQQGAEVQQTVYLFHFFGVTVKCGLPYYEVISIETIPHFDSTSLILIYTHE